MFYIGIDVLHTELLTNFLIQINYKSYDKKIRNIAFPHNFNKRILVKI